MRPFAGLLAMAALLAGQGVDPAFAADTKKKVAEAEAKPLPSAIGYTPQDEDERGMWLEMEEYERDLKHSKQVIRDPELNAYVRGVLCKTVGQEKCGAARIYIMRTPYFNASMAPNGLMTIWSGLLLRTRNEAELASVLGHEFGHFENQHSLRMFKEIRAKTDAMAWLSLVPFGTLAQIGLLGSVFSFSRDMEREADMKGLGYMHSAGYDPRAASAIWAQLRDEMDATAAERKRKSKKDKNGGFFATHPNTKERMDYLAAEAGKLDLNNVSKGDAEYRTILSKWWPMLIDDQIMLNDFGATEFLLGKLSSDGWTSDLLFARGELYRTRNAAGDMAKAVEFYTQSIAANPDLAETWRGLGLAQMKTGAREQGQASLREYLKRKPDAEDKAMISMMAGGA
jgi:beta-barrel assembly-enhancing protease